MRPRRPGYIRRTSATDAAEGAATNVGWRVAHAPAKINLGLRIVGRREDGYHLLDSLVVFASIGDHVAVRASEGAPRLTVRGPFAHAVADTPPEANLAVRAAAAFRAAFGGPAHDIRLWKRLPVAAGIGGGSSDAATVLRLLAAAEGVSLEDPDLHALALGLGADVPMCLDPKPARIGGVGETLTPAPVMPRLPAVLVNPGFPLSTPAVFKARQGDFSKPGDMADGYDDIGALAADIDRFGNDLTVPATALAPAIDDALSDLRRSALAAGMSGSGATCFGLYADERSARAAADQASMAGRWAVPTILNG